MEINTYSHFEQSSLINELSQGMELARQLKDQMGLDHSAETKEILLQQIVSSYDKALSMLGCGVTPPQQPHHLSLVQSPLMPSSPGSIVNSPNTNDLSIRSNINQQAKQCSLKRKSESTWTKQVKLNSENGLDGPPDDGHSWRKYGQKEILGAKHPRSYYRCTYRNVQDCWATRQVQKSDKDDKVFDITYRGKHTCSMIRRSKSAPTSPAKQEPKKIQSEHQQDSSMLFMFQANNAAEIHGFPSMELGCINNSLCGNMVSPSTSGSNYFSMSHCNLDSSIANVQLQQNDMGADIADMILAATSSTNSPTLDPDFFLDQWSFDQFNDPVHKFARQSSKKHLALLLM
ncbi:hypothetical protein V2J09_014621 [Rumex salicifolius]